MKPILAPFMILAAVLTHADGSQVSVQPDVQGPKVTVDVAAPKSSGMRHLTAEERAELRRQLYQYRLASKGS